MPCRPNWNRRAPNSWQFLTDKCEGYLDIELVYRLRQKESLGSVKQKVVSRIQQNESALCFGGLVTEFLSS